MLYLKPEYFFDLTQFSHVELFDSCEYVFEALSKIKPYLDKYKYFKIEVEIPVGVTLINPQSISIGKGTILEAGAYIQGPTIIGENCTIRHGAYIRGNVIIGKGSVVGHATEVKNSIFLNDSHAAHFAYVGDSILGNEVNLGAGVKCANLKLKGDLIQVSFGEKEFSTKCRKLGAIIGDGSQLGCNSVTNPGTFLGKNVFCYPCTTLSGFVEADCLVKPETKNTITKYTGST